MSDEQISIEITDKVAASVETKIAGIARVARDADSAVERLKASLANLDKANPVARLQSELSKLETQLVRNVTAQNNMAASDAKAALSKQKLATELQRTGAAYMQAEAAINKAVRAETEAQTAAQGLAAAQAKAATETQRLATEQARTATQTAAATVQQERAALAALRLAQAQEKTVSAADQMNKKADALRASLNPLWAAQQRYNNEIKEALALYKAGAIDVELYTRAVNRSAERLDSVRMQTGQFSNGLGDVSKKGKLAKNDLLNLGYQINDIGVSLASGQKPLTVFIQQGAQIAQIAASSGVGLLGMARGIGGVLLKFAPLIGSLASVVGGFVLFKDTIEDEAGLKEYVKTLGLTIREQDRLKDVTVTTGDVFKGLGKTLFDTFSMPTWLRDFITYFQGGMNQVLEIAKGIAVMLYSVFKGAFMGIVKTFTKLPAALGEFFIETVNTIIGDIEFLINASITGINKILGLANQASNALGKGDVFTLVDPVQMSRMENEFKGTVDEIAKTFSDEMAKAAIDGTASLEGFFDRWKKNSADIAKNRIKEQADAIKVRRTGDNPEEKRAAALAKVNAQLDNQLSRMNMLKPAREAQQQFDQIEENLIGKKITLNKAEEDSIKSKIATIQQMNYVQAEADRIYSQVVEPLTVYNASLKAADNLLKAGVISQEQYAGQVEGAADAYKSASDPLYQLNKELAEQYELLKMLPAQREIEMQIMQAQNTALSQNKILTVEQTQALREQLEVLQQLEKVSRIKDELQSNSSSERMQTAANTNTAIGELANDPKAKFTKGDQANAVIESNSDMNFGYSQEMFDSNTQRYEEMYTRIDELRKNNLINEQTANALQAQVWADQQNEKLNVASDFFGQMSQLSKSENSKMAAIGKTAAIAQAMINTYQAATGAYASLAAIPYVGPALGAAAAAAAIAAGLANVAQIRNQQPGFMAGGYTGNSATNEIAGVVHGKEFVMNAAATQRIGVGNLQALQAGANNVSKNTARGMAANDANGAKGQAPAPNVNVDSRVTAVVVSSKEAALAAMRSSEGKAFVIDTIEENGAQVARIVGTK